MLDELGIERAHCAGNSAGVWTAREPETHFRVRHDKVDTAGRREGTSGGSFCPALAQPREPWRGLLTWCECGLGPRRPARHTSRSILR